MTVALLGGGLKVKQKITGRMADALAELYLLSSCAEALRGRWPSGRGPAAPELLRAELPLPFRPGSARRAPQFPAALGGVGAVAARVSVRHAPPGQRPRRQGDRAPALQPGAFRDRLTRDIFCLDDPADRVGLLEYTLKKVIASEEADKKLERAIRKGEVRRYHNNDWIEEAKSKGVLTADEASVPCRAPRSRRARHRGRRFRCRLACYAPQPPEPKPRPLADGTARAEIPSTLPPSRAEHGDDTPQSARLALYHRFRGHRLGDHRPQGREHELARPPPDRGARRHRQSGRGCVRERRGQGPRHHERQGAELHRRRRHPRVRELRHRGPRSRTWSGRRSSCSTASSGSRSPSSPRSTAIASAAASNLALACDWRIADREEGDAARLPRGQARHLPGAERHGALDRARRADGCHDRHADRPHAATVRRHAPLVLSISSSPRTTISAGPRERPCCRSARPRAHRGGSG